jgi:hypothetical protein
MGSNVIERTDFGRNSVSVSADLFQIRFRPKLKKNDFGTSLIGKTVSKIPKIFSCSGLVQIYCIYGVACKCGIYIVFLNSQSSYLNCCILSLHAQASGSLHVAVVTVGCYRHSNSLQLL